jgi:hypothetical protein
MTGYSISRGRKKAVAQFTVVHGAWVLLILSVASIAILLLFLLGILRVD